MQGMINSFAIVFTESNSYKVKTRLSSMAVMTIDDHPRYVELEVLEGSQAAEITAQIIWSLGTHEVEQGPGRLGVFSPNQHNASVSSWRSRSLILSV